MKLFFVYSLCFFYAALNCMNGQNKEVALFNAIVSNDCQKVKLLVKEGVSLTERNQEGLTPFMVAAVYNRLNIFIKMCLYATEPKIYSVGIKGGKNLQPHFWKNPILHSQQKDKVIETVNRTFLKNIIELISCEKGRDAYRKEFAELYTKSQLNFIRELLLLKNNQNKTTQECSPKKSARFFDYDWVQKELKPYMDKNNFASLK